MRSTKRLKKLADKHTGQAVFFEELIYHRDRKHVESPLGERLGHSGQISPRRFDRRAFVQRREHQDRDSSSSST
jgi:hypothetical protein